MRPQIVEYRDEWPREFDAVAARLRDVLGPLALRIDHIGSTSVPGLCAKDVIDVQVTVVSLEQPELNELAGLRSRQEIVSDHVPPGADPDADHWRKRYFDTEDNRVHVHVRVAGRANQRYPLLFRDYLRAHRPAAEAYGLFKRRLAAICADTWTYADAKDPVCDIVMQSAEEWAARTGWSPA